MYFEPISKIAAMALIAISLTGKSNATQETPLAQTEIVLTVSGQGRLKLEYGGSAAFSIDMLRALPSETFITSTVWTEGINRFTGVPLAALVDSLLSDSNNRPASLLATAANDYAVHIPVPETGTRYPIIAYEMNGETMSLREKGPLWVIYPFDTEVEYRSETIYSRSIWQVEKIDLSE